jgi:hypothetical protein
VSARCRNYIRVHHAPDVMAAQWAQLICPPPSSQSDPSETQRACAA